jgi:hypothetical protein
MSTFRGESGGVGWIGTLRSMICTFPILASVFSSLECNYGIIAVDIGRLRL